MLGCWQQYYPTGYSISQTPAVGSEAECWRSRLPLFTMPLPILSQVTEGVYCHELPYAISLRRYDSLMSSASLARKVMQTGDGYCAVASILQAFPLLSSCAQATTTYSW